MTKPGLRQEWEARIADFRASGQSGTAWCATHNLRPNQLWYWLKKIITVENPSITQTQWMSVEINDFGPTGKRNGLLIKVGQAVIEVQPGFNPALLKEVVRTLTIC